VVSFVGAGHVGVLVLKGKRLGVEVFEPLSPEAAAMPATAAYLRAFKSMRIKT
jgi:hypothetical protein